MFLLGRHGKGGHAGDLHKGVKAHQVAQDQVHVHSACHVAAVDAAGVRPGAVRGTDALGEGVHLAHPAVQIPARQGIGKAHGGFVGVAGDHGVQCFAVGERFVGAHVGVVRAVDVVRDGKRHLERVVQLVGVVGQQQGNGHIFGQATGGHLFGTVFFVDDDVGVSVHDVGALGLHLIDGEGSNMAPAGSTRQLNRTANDRKSAKIRFMWTIPLKSDKLYEAMRTGSGTQKTQMEQQTLYTTL